LDSLVATADMTPQKQGSSGSTANGEGTKTMEMTSSASTSTSTDVEVLRHQILELEQQNAKLVVENQWLEKKLDQIHRKCERFRLRKEDL